MKCSMKHAFYAVLLIVSFFISSCSKDDSNPVESTFVVRVEGYLRRAAGPGDLNTILKADLLFDGNVIASANFQTATNGASLDGTVSSVKKGTHTIAFRITNQKSSPNGYALDEVKLTAGNSIYKLEKKLADLATGESITYSITL